jgi:type II secretory pathway component PulM
MQQTIINNYTTAAQAAKQQADKFKKQANTYSLLRLVVFGLMILAIYLTIAEDNFTIMAVAGVVLMLCFAWLVKRQAHYEHQRDYYLDMERINLNEIDSITAHYNLYTNGSAFASEKHFYTADLDIFGNASLFQLINRAATANGNYKLATWLKAPADKQTIESRQQAVTEIAEKADWKKEMQALLLFARQDDANSFNNLFRFLKMPIGLKGEKWLAAYTLIAPWLVLAAIIAAAFTSWGRSALTLLGIFNLGIVATRAGYIKKADMIADKIGKVLCNYAAVFSKIESQTWAAGYNAALAQKLKTDGTSAKITALATLITKLNYHLNLIVGAMLNAVFVWDIKQIIAIENWKRANHANIEDAFDIIAEFEAVISLSVTAINYPDWSIPVITDGNGYTLTATHIAHPLIRGTRVDNDYELNDTFKIDIITGSNMAGKSTFLRTVGINSVLALAGARVCAAAMHVSVITIVSYMRIKDSLNESTSTFKAELDRLQMLLAAVENENHIFFLIDEMLRGTNSMDKYLGSKAVIEQLIAKKAVGMVATHDLQIARLEDKYPDYVRNYYFDIQVQDGEMLFDYKLKHGECKTFNASLLLKQIGINVGEE